MCIQIRECIHIHGYGCLSLASQLGSKQGYVVSSLLPLLTRKEAPAAAKQKKQLMERMVVHHYWKCSLGRRHLGPLRKYEEREMYDVPTQAVVTSSRIELICEAARSINELPKKVSNQCQEERLEVQLRL